MSHLISIGCIVIAICLISPVLNLLSSYSDGSVILPVVMTPNPRIQFVYSDPADEFSFVEPAHPGDQDRYLENLVESSRRRPVDVISVSLQPELLPWNRNRDPPPAVRRE